MTVSVSQYLRRSPQQLKLVYGGHSTKGIKEENQDAFAVLEPNASERLTKGAFVAVADGVSSASHGREAAQMAVTMAAEEYMATPETWSTQKSLAKVLTSLNRWLCGQANKATSTKTTNPQQNQQWLTTLSGLVLKSATATMFHVGDSRIYKFTAANESNQAAFEQITADHVSTISGRAILTRAMGADQLVKIDTMSFPLENKDLFLLCSDGLTGFIDDVSIQTELQSLGYSPSQEALETCAKRLVDRALARGSDDNISCVLVSVEQVASRELEEMHSQLTQKRVPPVMLPGHKIDNFRVLHVLHESPRSHLYQVEDVETKEVRVLKAPSLNFEEDQHYLQGFINESWVGERINHKNVMQIFPQQTASPYLYHTAEYINGHSLAQWIIDNPKRSLAEVRHIIGQLIEALRAFQRFELLHRDVKPANALISPQQQVTLVDYGTVAIPALLENNNHINNSAPQGATRYMAPETFSDNKYDFKSELFSLGVTCYELLSGEVPYKALEDEKLYATHRSGWQYRPIRLIRPELPQWIELALEKACHPVPSQRYASYSEFWQDLNQPNHEQIRAQQNQPLLKRDPVKFWQGVSVILSIALILSLLY